MLVRVIGRHPDLGFSWNGREVYPGDELDVPEPYARALQSRGWVEPVAVGAPVAGTPAVAAPGPAVVHRDPGVVKPRRQR